MDVYDCRSVYDFYNRFAALILQETADFSPSLGFTPQSHTPEEILNLPEKIAQKHHIHIVVCMDEFQQIEGLTTYQMNFIRAICSGIHTGFGTQATIKNFNLGTKSNHPYKNKSDGERNYRHCQRTSLSRRPDI